MGINNYLKAAKYQEEQFIKGNYLRLWDNIGDENPYYYSLTHCDKETAQKEILARYVAV